MTAQIPTRARVERSPFQRALLVLLVAAVITGGAALGAVLIAPAAAEPYLAWTAGVAAAGVCLTAVGAAWYAEASRLSCDRVIRSQVNADRLEKELSWLVGDALPTAVKLLHDGEPAERVFASMPRPASSGLQRLLGLLTGEIEMAERLNAATLAQRTALEDDAARLADEIVPAVVRRIRDGESVEAVLLTVPKPASGTLERLLRTLVTEAGASERRAAAAMAACAHAAARVQAQSTKTLADLRELERRYSEDKVFADLLELDHRVSQMGRLADSIALLSGGRSGRRWTKPIVIESILRGAMGRIDAYRRVRLHSTSTAAVYGYAAEGVMHALAELMDNATAFSAHGSDVHVYVEEEDAGVVVTIEDSGLGMRKRERGRAERLVGQAHDLATLPGTRLGLAVVGRLASRYGLTVNFRPSSRGGTGVVVMIPRQLLTEPRLQDSPALMDGAARSAVPVPAGQAVTPEGEEVTPEGEEDGGPALPKRPRGATLAAASHPAGRPASPPAAQPHAAGARFAAFRQAGDRNRQGAPASPETGAQ